MKGTLHQENEIKTVFPCKGNLLRLSLSQFFNENYKLMLRL